MDAKELIAQMPAGLHQVLAEGRSHELMAERYKVAAVDLPTVVQIIGTKLAARRREYGGIHAGLQELAALRSENTK